MRAGLASVLFVSLVGCSVIVDADARGRGIGALCTASDECHAGFCDDGICVAPCTAASECPAPSQCFAGKCQRGLKATALWVGVVAGGEGWTLTHHEGMTAAAKQLPYLSWNHKQNIVPFNGSIGAGVDEAVRSGSQVVIANSFSQRDEILKKAEQYPNVTFLTCASYTSNGKNAMSYTAHSEQAWYVAGKVAALKSVNKRLGYIGSFITPEVVRHINAFFLGARSVDPAVVLEVNWLGFWFDYNDQPRYSFTHTTLTGGKPEAVYREELLAYRLLEDGCDVVAHGADNQRAVRLIERLDEAGRLIRPTWSFSNDNRNGYRKLTADQLPNGPPMKTCIGSPYWDWSHMYRRLLDQIHRGTFDPSVNLNEPMLASSESSVGFELNPNVGLDDSVVRSYVNLVASKGWQSVFDGGYQANGQRDKDGNGVPDVSQVVREDERITEDEYRRMCWFVKGIVERADPTVPAAKDLVLARVPDKARLADAKWLADIQGPPDAPLGVGLVCDENR